MLQLTLEKPGEDVVLFGRGDTFGRAAGAAAAGASINRSEKRDVEKRVVGAEKTIHSVTLC